LCKTNQPPDIHIWWLAKAICLTCIYLKNAVLSLTPLISESAFGRREGYFPGYFLKKCSVPTFLFSGFYRLNLPVGHSSGKKSGSYIRIVESYRDVDGHSRHRILYNLGKVSDYTPDQLQCISSRLYELGGGT
jgi:hypothetical protein